MLVINSLDLARSRSSTPLHLNISEQIHQQIIDKRYLPGDKLPSERELTEEWKVSRITIRRAIANLVQQGLVNTHQGKGAFVTRQDKVAYTLSSPLMFLQNDLANKGIELSLQNITFELVTPSKEVQKILELPTQNPTAYLQKKLLITGDVPGGVDVTYILPELGQRFGDELKHDLSYIRTQ